MEKPDLEQLHIRCNCNIFHPREMIVVRERTPYKVIYQCPDCGKKKIAKWFGEILGLKIEDYDDW